VNLYNKCDVFRNKVLSHVFRIKRDEMRTNLRELHVEENNHARKILVAKCLGKLVRLAPVRMLEINIKIRLISISL